MTSRLSLSVILSVAVALLGTACSTSPISRIDANRALYESWPLEIQEAVLNGKVIKGMTPDMVQMAVGKPSEVVLRDIAQGGDEIWVYRSGGGTGLGNSGVSISAGSGGVGIGGGTSTGVTEPVQEREVVFRNGVVSRSDFGDVAPRSGG